MAEKKEKLKEELRTYLLEFMKKHHIGIGSSSFAQLLREIADYVDD